MKNTQNFTKTEVLTMRDEVNEALKAIADKYGAVATVGKIRYGQSVDIQIEIAKITTDAAGNSMALTKEAQKFLNCTYQHNIPKEALNTPFTYNDKTIVIVGMKARKQKQQMLYTMNGANYRCNEIHMRKMVKIGMPGLSL